ncbi:MAG TPA: hypothetical protein VNE58_10315 [Casimicrobiaceae bacterium]|nr:hypothetical protein [Casimicrobiaceae bacterium]
MQRRVDPAVGSNVDDALVAFLDRHVGASFDDDVGPLFGQARVILDTGIVNAEMLPFWREAVSASVSSGDRR